MFRVSRADSTLTEVIHLIRGCESYMKRKGLPTYSSTENSYIFKESLLNLSNSYEALNKATKDAHWLSKREALVPLLSLPNSEPTSEELSLSSSDDWEGISLLETKADILLEQQAEGTKLSEDYVQDLIDVSDTSYSILQSTGSLPNVFDSTGLPVSVGSFNGVTNGGLLTIFSGNVTLAHTTENRELVEQSYKELRENYFVKSGDGNYVNNGYWFDGNQSEFKEISWISKLYQGLADYLLYVQSFERELDKPKKLQLTKSVETYEDLAITFTNSEVISSRPSLVVMTNNEVVGGLEDVNISGRLLYKNHIAQIPLRFDGDFVTPRSDVCRQLPFQVHKNVVWSFEVELEEWYGPLLDENFSFNITIETSRGPKFLNNIRYMSELSDDKKSAKFTLDFGNIRANFEGTDFIPAKDILAVVLNIPAPIYDDASEDPIKVDNKFSVNIKKSRAVLRNSNTLYLSDYVKPVISKKPNLGMATGFDDVISYSPKYLIDVTSMLGYDLNFNHYMGMSNYPDLVWSDVDGKFITNPNGTVDKSVMKWHIDFAKKIVESNPEAKIIFSVSMEMFYPYIGNQQRSWLQRSHTFKIKARNGNNITVEGYWPYSTTEDPLFGGTSYKGVFNPDNEYTNYVEYVDSSGIIHKLKIGAVSPSELYDQTDIFLSEPIPAEYDILLGKLGFTGYTPPSVFMSPCSTEAKDYFKNIFTNVKSELILAGVTHKVTYQVGEPWWWDGAYQNGLLMAYDSNTVTSAIADGVDLNVLINLFKDPLNPVYTPEQEAALKFLSDKLGEFTQYPPKTIGSDPSTKWATLLFLPQVFSESNIHLRKINFPNLYWGASSGFFNECHLEAYDWLIADRLDLVIKYNSYGSNALGFPREDTTSLLGFTPADNTSDEMWLQILSGYNNGDKTASTQCLWSFTQVVRDNVIIQSKL